MLTYEITAMLCVATFALGMGVGVGLGVFVADMRRVRSLLMYEPIEHFDSDWHEWMANHPDNRGVKDDANWPRTIVNAEKGFKVLNVEPREWR